MPLRVMFQDEARLGRINSPRACWAPLPIRPSVAAQAVRQYTYLYGAISPKDGVGAYLVLPDMDTVCMQIFLDAVSAQFKHEYIAMVLDGAPNHRTPRLKVPDNITLIFLPPYSPELNPKENIWDEIREKIFKNYALEHYSIRLAQIWDSQIRRNVIHHVGWNGGQHEWQNPIHRIYEIE
jgi:hypothetical protein